MTYDANGNPDPNGQYDQNGDLIGTVDPIGPGSILVAPTGAPPAPGLNSVWSTVQSLIQTATGTVKQVEQTINSTQIQKAQTAAQVALLQQPQVDWKMWAILGLIVFVLIAWLR